jgi:hypothetical protein
VNCHFNSRGKQEQLMNSNGNGQQNQDQTITCRDCKGTFVFEAGEQAFFAEKGFTPPTRCKPCRQARKAQQAQQQAVAGPPTGGGPVGRTAPVVYVEPDPSVRPRSSKGRGGNNRHNRDDD